jgi:hypothetical protein
MKNPAALQQSMTVTSFPLSAPDNMHIFFRTAVKTIFGGRFDEFCTTVSSLL